MWWTLILVNGDNEKDRMTLVKIERDEGKDRMTLCCDMVLEMV